jgi:hypothetical protein
VTERHRADYFPLRFDCVLDDGTTRSAGVVSGWLTPMTVVLMATELGLSWIGVADRPIARVTGPTGCRTPTNSRERAV